MSWKPIVVGVDASPEAAAAAAFACRMAEAAGTTCHLVHASREVWSTLAAMELPDRAREFSRAQIEEAHEEVQHALWNLVPAKQLQHITIRLGRAPMVLRQTVAELGAGLVVLGGKHHSVLGRWLGGSTSLNVVRTTEVPVLVTAGTPPETKRVLVAVDLSRAAVPTLRAAEEHAALFGAELRALSVLEPLPVIPETTAPYDSSEYYAMLQELLRRDVWSQIRAHGVQTLVRHGMAVETILREAAEWPADLLVVGSHGKGWVDRLLLGSVTERLLNHLPTSLLVVPTSVVEVREPARGATQRTEQRSAFA